MICMPLVTHGQVDDWRNIVYGDTIPDETYSDQPYIVKTDDGAWLCAMTTGSGHEGASGQHIITQRSFDNGKTWVDKQDVEPSNGPEASYAVLLKAPSGRVFVFYNHNTDNVRTLIGDDPPYKNGKVWRVDSQGYFVFKYSDDHGKSWSSERYTIPVREFEIDRNNVYKGDIRFFWNVGKAFSYDGSAYVPLIKVGGFGACFFTSNEGVLLESPNLFEVQDPADATWITLPDGDKGLRTPEGGGPIAAEQSYSVLSDGSIFCVYRTIDGYPVYSYSRDKGHTWDAPKYLRYANGRLVKHPRAANFAWKCQNGKYLYWFHNHGGEYIRHHPQRTAIAYNDRNPAWIMGGVEKDGAEGKVIEWTQPEILLYADDPYIRMSYPDLVETDGQYYISETQKDIARIHKIDTQLLMNLWDQLNSPEPAGKKGMVLSWNQEVPGNEVVLDNPDLPGFYVRDWRKQDGSGRSTRNGFSLDFKFKPDDIIPGEFLLNTKDKWGQGWSLRFNHQKRLELSMSDGRTESIWPCDPEMFTGGKEHHVTVIVDGGPGIIMFVIDGVLNDGGASRKFGWGRFSPHLQSVAGSPNLIIAPSISQLKIYNRAISVTESIGNFYNQEP